VPPIVTAASGHASFVLSADRKTLTYHVTHNVPLVTAAHIHLGAAGENGSVVYPLSPVGPDMTGTIALANTNDLTNLDQGAYYVNVHSMAHASGEVRGQILHPGDKLFVATLTAGQETPPTTSMNKGTAAAILDATGTNLHVHLNTTATPTEVHIHAGLATVAGPVVHPIMPPAPTIDADLVLAPGEADHLLNGEWYANVHTLANPKGDVRGQLILPGEILYSVIADKNGEAPPTTSNGTGNGQFILSPDQTSMRYEVALANVTPSAAHIHKGASGVTGPILYVLTLGGPGLQGTTNVMASDLADLNASPPGWYLNVHSAAFPDGEIRGQITNPN
jgi:hypothetical protein